MMTDPLEQFYGPVPEPPRPRGPHRSLTILAVAVIAAAAGAGAVVGLHANSSPRAAGPGSVTPSASAPASPGGTAARPASPGHSVAPAAPGASAIPVPPGSAPAAANGTLNPQAVADKVQPGMVNISAPQAYGQSLSEGTGMILTTSGLVLTNNHVIQGATAPTATLVNSGQTYKATILGYDATHDVALLQLVGASGLTPVTVGDSASVKIGQHVLGLGNAQGQGGQPTVAPGQVTALNQTISPSDSATGATETLHGTIQTSAQIQEGDSGGPLANAAGQVIGMDTAASQTQSFNGSSAVAGYAIPLDTALGIARQIAAGTQTATIQIGLPPFMGVEVADTVAGCQQGGGLGGLGGFGGGGGATTSSGAFICAVYSGTPAASAGLAQGDVITAANGKPVNSARSLITITSALRSGQSLPLSYVDSAGVTRSATVPLIGGPAK